MQARHNGTHVRLPAKRSFCYGTVLSLAVLRECVSAFWRIVWNVRVSRTAHELRARELSI
jgi:hypothetical protein